MKALFLALIRFYRKYLSPLTPPKCRFVPTCSSYAIEAFSKRGFFVGGALTAYRILRCNPFCAGGYDPVPEKGFYYRGSRDIPRNEGDDRGDSGNNDNVSHDESDREI